MHFCVVHVYFFVSGSKVIKGVKRSNLSNAVDRKNQNISNGKNNSVIVFHMDRGTKVSTVITLPDLPLRGQRSKKVKIINYFK